MAGLLAVLFGVAWLIGALGVWHLSVEAVVALGLMLLGASLVVTGRTDWSLSRRSWPVWLGAGLIVVLVSTSSTFGIGGALNSVSFGNTSVMPRPIPGKIHGGFGNLTVNAINMHPGTYKIVSVAGQTTVISLPLQDHIHIDARVVGGQICIQGSDAGNGARRPRGQGRGDAQLALDDQPRRAPGVRSGADRFPRRVCPAMTAAVATYQYRTSRVAVGTFFLLLGAAFFLDSFGVFRVTATLFWPLFVISLGAGLLLHRARRMQVEEDRSAQLAVAEERVRIARELHDIVAHGVSLMTIQIAAARRVGATKPQSATESLEAAEQTGRQTLSELEGMLAVLRGADASIVAAADRHDGAGEIDSRTPCPGSPTCRGWSRRCARPAAPSPTPRWASRRRCRPAWR